MCRAEPLKPPPEPDRLLHETVNKRAPRILYGFGHAESNLVLSFRREKLFEKFVNLILVAFGVKVYANAPEV
jgi:hypothetical protein